MSLEEAPAHRPAPERADARAACAPVKNRVCWSWLCWSLLGWASAWGQSPGLVEARPAEGPVIETPQGFLVPYDETIPGTEITFRMVPVPGGTFLLGSPADEADRSDDEGPQVRVELPAFWIGKYEVTWQEYKQFMRLAQIFERFDDLGVRPITPDRTADVVTAPSKLYEPGFTFEGGEEPQQPAITMSQFAARQYTKWLSLLTQRFYRLPSEAEWEYACRAGTATAYSFGDDPSELEQYAWYYDNSDDVTHPVGEKEPNPWGLYDMHGNAREWVLDAYSVEYYAQLARQPGDTGRGIPAADAVAWPTQLYPRVLRGGSWNLDPDRLRSAAREQSHDDLRSYDPNSPRSPWWFASDESQDIGFRIVRPVTAPPATQRARYWDANLPSIQEVADARIDEEGRGERGLVDPQLPAAIDALPARNPPDDAEDDDADS